MFRSASRLFSSASKARAVETFGSVHNQRKTSPAKVEEKIQVFKHVLHCSFLKNNTFLTLTKVEGDINWAERNPNKSWNDKVLYFLTLPQKICISQSAGSVGFRKAQRGEYEASFQLSSFVFKQMIEKKYLQDSGALEVVVKGFGKGRKAFFDSLKGKEGNGIRDRITKLSDLTPIRFGGNRPAKHRRI